MFREPEALD